MRTKTIRAYVRPSARHPAGPQERALAEAGASTVYVEGRGRETWQAFVLSLRSGDVALVNSLSRISIDREDMRQAIRDVAARGVVLRELETGREWRPADADAAIAALDAADELAKDGRRLTPEKARANAQERWGKPERTSKTTALRIWKDTTTYPRADDALAHPDMKGWSRSRAQDVLGRRWPDYPGGRPRKLKR